MKALDSCAHSFRLYRPDDDPEQMYFPGEGGRVDEP